MGIDAKGAQFLLAARGFGVSFARSATLGRQRLFLPPSWLRHRLHAFGIDLEAGRAAELFTAAEGFAEPFFRVLGAERVVSLDASDYEGATRLVDLNGTLPADLEGAFSAVVDAGTLEHVFDFPAAVGNCMRMVERGGHLLMVTVANNMAGHGFYQFSPELLYRVFSEASGFRVERMLVTEISSARWYEVSDPLAVGDRVQLRTFRPVYLCVAARRVAIRPVLAAAPQQSDYLSAWQGGGPPEGSARAGPDLVERYAPHCVARTLRSIYHLAQATVLPFDRRSFRRVEITDLETRRG